MSKYASLINQSEDWVAIGPFRLRKLHDITAGEAGILEGYNRQSSEATYMSLRLAQKIASHSKCSVQEALEKLSDPEVTGSPDFIAAYLDDLTKLQEASPSAIDQQRHIVTVVLQMRGQLKDVDGNWISVSDWSSDDTDALTHDTVQAVASFFGREQQKLPEPTSGNETSPAAEKS